VRLVAPPDAVTDVGDVLALQDACDLKLDAVFVAQPVVQALAAVAERVPLRRSQCGVGDGRKIAWWWTSSRSSSVAPVR
jgi:hypothetical protein